MLFIKICQQFLLPSVFILILILVGLIFLLKKKAIGRFFIIIGILLYYFFSITPVSNLLISPLENKYPKLRQNEFQQADKLVLLLGGQESNILRASEVFRIYNFKKEKLIIYIAGRDFLSKQNQAFKLKNYLIDRGIDKQNVLLEDRSKTTFESAQNIAKILKQKPFFLVTSAYHLPRAMWIFKKYNTNPIPTPTDFKTENKYDLFSFIPSANSLKNVDLAFHEYFGILYYRMRKK